VVVVSDNLRHCRYDNRHNILQTILKNGIKNRKKYIEYEVMNKKLHIAKEVKNDEFYTQYEDIRKEIMTKAEHFENQIVYCNCDDYRWNNYVKFFKDAFSLLKLKKLIATNYDIGDGAYYYEYDGANETIKKLEGNGDFRSAECKEILKSCDIVVSNPPFSLFRLYMDMLHKSYETTEKLF
jgi:hypothetical protein